MIWPMIVAAVMASVQPLSPPPPGAPPESIVVIGDSVAHSMDSPTLVGVGRDGCGITRYPPVKTISVEFSKACAATRDEYILSLPHADAYLISSTWEINDFLVGGEYVRFGTRQWSDFLTHEYEALITSMPGPTYLATVPPRGPVDGVVPRWTARDAADYERMNQWYRRFVAAHRKVGLVDVAGIVCPGDACPEWVDGVRVRPDSGHYDARSAEWIGPKIKEELQRVWAEQQTRGRRVRTGA